VDECGTSTSEPKESVASGYDVRLGGGDLAGALHGQICELYDAVFSQPPFAWTANGSQEHAQELAALRTDPTFGLAIAMLGDQLVGFAYGVRLPVNHRWWTGFPEPLPDGLTREWEARTFALIDFAVYRGHRGRGLGRRLLELLLGSRSEERTILSVQPTATATQAIYRHLGWQHLGRKGPLDGVTPAYWDIYLLNHKGSRVCP
jgi:ribosomal protein S18 acetylase RimI-like enzyme